MINQIDECFKSGVQVGLRVPGRYMQTVCLCLRTHYKLFSPYGLKKKKEVLFGVKKVILVHAPVRTHAHLVSLETPPAVCDQL